MRSRARSAVVPMFAVAAMIGGCAGSDNAAPRGTLRTVSIGGGASLTRRPPASLAQRALPPVGTTQRVDSAGAKLEVKVRRVMDPLRGSGAQLQSGTRAVGVIVQIRSSGPAVYDSSATGDVSLVASAGPVTPLLATRGVCRTPLNDFDRYITAGEDRVGCVVFGVRNAATLDAVRFLPHAQLRGQLIWAP